MRHLLILFALPCFAGLNNGETFYEAGGSTQTNVPRTVHRYFARGEFPSGSYPKPRVGGSVPATWQVDVESTWPDGSVLAASISMPVSITANGSVVVDFVSDSNSCHLGNLATCQAAALNQASMLTFNSSAWDAVLTGTANSISYSASARTMMTDGACSQYLLRGPVVTRVLCEDLTRPNPVYDFGWQWNGTAWQAPSTDDYKSVHPLFALSFYTGWAGVEVEVIALQAATTRFQRQVFDLLLTKSGSSVVHSKSGFDLPRSSGYSRYFWDGTAPGAVQIDFNLKYMIHSRILPPYDYAKQWSGATDVSQYDTNLGGADVQDCAGSGYCGSWYQNIPGTGGRGDIGLIPRYYVEYLIAMGDTTQFNLATRKAMFDKLIVGNGDAGMTLPVHYLEYDNSSYRDSPADGQRYYFDAAQTTPAFGRMASMYARPVWRSYGGNEHTEGGAADRIVPVCSSGICDGGRGAGTGVTKGWVLDNAHMPSLFAIPYILTGRYSYLIGQISLAGYMPAKAGQWCANDALRCFDWGLQGSFGNQRYEAWTLREIAWAALLVPSARPEREYFRRMLEKNDEMWEGVQDIYGGNAGATTSATYCSVTNDDGKSNTISGSSSGAGNAWGPYVLNGIGKVLGTSYPIYSITTLTVDGVSKTTGVKGVDTGRDWYYYPGGVTLFQDTGASPVGSLSSVYVAYRMSYNAKNPWCSGRHIQMKGMPNAIGNLWWPSDKQYNSYMLSYYLWVLKWMEDTQAWVHFTTGQPLFKYSVAGVARYVVGWAVDPASNVHDVDMYRDPTMTTANTLPNTWTERQAAFTKQTPLQADITNSTLTVPFVGTYCEDGCSPRVQYYAPTLIKVEDEWMKICSYANNTPSAGNSTWTVCSGGRGAFGTTAVAHSAGATVYWDRQEWNGYAAGHSYPNLFASAVAMFEEYTIPAGTGRRAWERVMGDMNSQQTRMTGPEYAFVPRDRIQNLVVTPGSGTLALAWTAPNGTACTVALDPTSSDDSGDTTATAKGRSQSYSTTGLSAGSKVYRITCGTARISGSVTIP